MMSGCLSLLSAVPILLLLLDACTAGHQRQGIQDGSGQTFLVDANALMKLYGVVSIDRNTLLASQVGNAAAF